ncbi:MAG: thiol peroxidase [bacterium]
MDTLENMLKRRSVNFFDAGVEISKNELEEILNLAGIAPSSSNTQPWEVVAVTEEKAKEELRASAFDQPKVTDASATLILLADPDAYKRDNPTYDSFVEKGYMQKEEMEDYYEMVEGLYSNFEEPDRYAVKNSALFAMSIMYSAKNFGWDTHPMIGFDPDDVKEKFNIPDKYLISMLITVGRFDESKSLLPRNNRKSAADFLSYNSYSSTDKPEFENPYTNPEPRSVTMEGNKLELVGRRLQEGDRAPDFTVLDRSLNSRSLGDIEFPVLISAVPSLDTSVCSIQTRTFADKIENISSAGDFVTISCDTPFAQGRFCADNDLDIITYSDLNGKEFALQYGLLVKELGLCARAIFVIDENRTVCYRELVGEISEEPDYEAALEALSKL